MCIRGSDVAENEKFLRKIALLSLKNAEQHVKDAKILLKKRSFGHAFALAVLGEEELAKAVMYHLCAEGIFGIKGKWRGDSLHHARKQQFAFGIAFLYELSLIAEEAVEFAQRKGKKDAEKVKEAFEKKMAQILWDEQKLFISKHGDVYEHLKHFEELQRKREKAMYVEVELKQNEATSPKGFKKSEAKQYIAHVEERVEVLRDEISKKMRLQDKQWAMHLLKMRLSQFDEEGKKRILEWYGLSAEDLDKFGT
jgi:AbiV family abortive infection protein